MRAEISVIVASVLLLGACGQKESDSATADGAGPGAAPAVANTGFDYTCSDGKSFNARIDRGNVVLTIDGQTITLPPDTNASGAHYSGEGTTFIATGKEATLIKAGENARTCETK